MSSKPWQAGEKPVESPPFQGWGEVNRFAVQLPEGQFVSILTISPTLPSAIVHWGAVDDDQDHPMLVFTDRAKALAVAALTRGKVVPWQPRHRQEVAVASS